MISETEVADIVIHWAGSDTGSHVYRDGARYRLDAMLDARQWVVTNVETGQRATFYIEVRVKRAP